MCCGAALGKKNHQDKTAPLLWHKFGTTAQSHTCAGAPQSRIAPLELSWQLRVKLRVTAGQELLHGTQSCCPSWAG